MNIDWPIYRTAVPASKCFAKQSPRNTELLPQASWSWTGEGGWGHVLIILPWVLGKHVGLTPGAGV